MFLQNRHLLSITRGADIGPNNRTNEVEVHKHYVLLLDEAEFEPLRREGFRQPDWTGAVGVDGYGLYADLSVEGVPQRMRWIPPGELPDGLAATPSRSEKPTSASTR